MITPYKLIRVRDGIILLFQEDIEKDKSCELRIGIHNESVCLIINNKVAIPLEYMPLKDIESNTFTLFLAGSKEDKVEAEIMNVIELDSLIIGRLQTYRDLVDEVFVTN